MSEGINFSIYKYSDNLVRKNNNLEEDDEIELEHLEKSREKVINNISNRISNNRSHSEVAEVQNFNIDDRNIKGITFTTFNEPTWKITLMDFLSDQSTEDDIDISDSISPSYIMFIIEGKSLYIITGGYGSKYITNYIDLNFGVDLLPKIFKENENRIKGFSNQNFSGNRQTASYTNKNHTSIKDEREVYSFYKELKLEVPMSFLVEHLGIPYEKNDNMQRLINIINKDSLLIKVAMSFEEMLTVLEKMNTIYEKREADFAMNHLLPIQQLGLKKAEVENAFYNQLKLSKYTSFKISGVYDLEEFSYINCFSLSSEDGQLSINSSYTDLNFEFIFKNLFENEKLNLTIENLKKVFKKWELIFWGDGDEQLIDEPKLIDLVTGSFDFTSKTEEKHTLFLLNGEWLTLNQKYTDILDNQYNSFYEDNYKEIDNLSILEKVTFKEKDSDGLNETKLLNRLKKSNINNLIIVHPTILDNIEIADIILWDEEYIYLISSKTSFNAAGSRDLLGQMESSITYYKSLLDGPSKVEKLKEYYQKIISSYESVEFYADWEMSETEFLSLFDKRPIFIGAFVHGFVKDTKQVYSKVLITDLIRRVKREYNEKVLFMNHVE